MCKYNVIAFLNSKKIVKSLTSIKFNLSKIIVNLC